MELRILDSIMHGVLKPWKLDTSNNKRFTELVKAAKKANPSTCREQHAELYSLLADFPTLQKILTAEPQTEISLQPLCFNTNLPKYKDTVTHFYYLIIEIETQRIYNVALEFSNTYSDIRDIIYQTEKILTYAKVLAKQVSIEMKDEGYISIPDENNNLTHYVLYYLKHSLIQLYFSIQEQYKNTLQQSTSLEDFYILDLEESITNMVSLEKVEEPIKNDKSNQEIQEKLSFGFNADVVKLRTVINQLCVKIELLNNTTETEDLIKILTAKDVLPGSVRIQFNCETVQLRYIIDKLKPFFNALNPKNIELSACFFTKKGTLIKAQNLYTNKIANPKEKDKIDNIIKQLQ
jgi:hypothetical protein